MKLSKEDKYALFCELVEDVIDAATDYGHAQATTDYGDIPDQFNRLNMAADKLYNALRHELKITNSRG